MSPNDDKVTIKSLCYKGTIKCHGKKIMSYKLNDKCTCIKSRILLRHIRYTEHFVHVLSTVRKTLSKLNHYTDYGHNRKKVEK